MAGADKFNGQRARYIKAELSRAKRSARDLFATLSGEFNPDQDTITSEMQLRAEAVFGAFSLRHHLSKQHQITDVVQGYVRDHFGTYIENASQSTADPDGLVIIGSTMTQALQTFTEPVKMKLVDEQLVPDPTPQQQLIAGSDHKGQLILHLIEEIYLGPVGDRVLELVKSGITKDVPTLFRLQNHVLLALVNSDYSILRNWISSGGSDRPGNIYEKTTDKIELMETALRLQSRATLARMFAADRKADQGFLAALELVYTDVLGGHKAALEGRYESIMSDDPAKRLDALQGIVKNDFMTTSMRAIIQLQAKIKTDPEVVGKKTKAAAKNSRKVSGVARRDARFHRALRTTVIPSESLLDGRIVKIGTKDKPQLLAALQRLLLTPNQSARNTDMVRFAGLSPHEAMFNRTRDIIPIMAPQATTEPAMFNENIQGDFDKNGFYAQNSTEFHMTRAQNAVGLVEKALQYPQDSLLADDAAAYLVYIVTDLSEAGGEINQFKQGGRREILDELINLHFSPDVPMVVRKAVEHCLQEVAANWTLEDQKYIVDNFLVAGGKDPNKYFGNGKMAQFLFQLIYLDHDNVPNIPDEERTTQVATYIHEKLRDRVRNYAQWDNGTNLHRSILDETAQFDVLQHEVTVLGEPTVADVQLVIQHLHEMRKVNPNMPFVQTITDRWGAASSLSAEQLVDANGQPVPLEEFIIAQKLNRRGANMKTWAQDYQSYQSAVADLKRVRPRIVLDDIVDAASFAATNLEKEDLFLAFAQTLTREIQNRITPSGGVDVLSEDYQTRLDQIKDWITKSSGPEALERIASEINPTQVLALVRTAMTEGITAPAAYYDYVEKFRAELTHADFAAIIEQQKTLHNLGAGDVHTMVELLRPLLTTGQTTDQLGLPAVTGEIAGAVQAFVSYLERSKNLQIQATTAMASANNTLREADLQIGTSNATLYKSRADGVTVLEAGITQVYRASVKALTDAVTIDEEIKIRIKQRLDAYFETAMMLIQDAQKAMDAYSEAVTAGARVHGESARVLATETEHVANQRRYYVKLARSRMKTLYHMDDPKELIGSQKRIEKEAERIQTEEERLKRNQEKPEPEE